MYVKELFSAVDLGRGNLHYITLENCDLFGSCIGKLNILNKVVLEVL